MESDFVQAGQSRLQYYQQGNGPETVVLVHGYASSAALWRLTIEKLGLDEEFRVIAINNRGAGDSSRSTSEAGYTVETFAVDLFNAVQVLGLSDFTLVGHSMGGATVTQFSLEHQDLLKALVLVNSTPLSGRPLADDWEEVLKDSIANGGLTQGDMGFNSFDATEDFKDAVIADIRRNPVERAIGGRRSMSGLRLRDRLGEIRVPTLVVGGDLDVTIGVDEILADYFALPEETRHLHIYHGIGHSPNVEVPASFAHLIARFIAEVNTGKPVQVASG